MPCWYFEKKEIKNTPSYRDGIDSGTEARYRREGARFIVDAGTKLGLRYDTCATGVVYFHRFYMFHSFKDFPRYVTASCCLFLAGKVEETPKKCKDIIKVSQQILKPKQFAQFGNDPKEEVMTLERILLQTIKFDLQADHPYAYLLKYAKHVKADKEKVQKLVQMAWTFINDSLCTTLCLQWEPEIIATSLMYLGTRLNKMDITDWNGRAPGAKIKWWESLVADLTVELMEDICHQVLDLYSPSNQTQATESGESPPPPPPVQNHSRTPSSTSGDRKRSVPTTPSEPVTPGSQSAKSMKLDTGGSQSKHQTPVKSDKGREHSSSRVPSQPQVTDPAQGAQSAQVVAGQEMYGVNPTIPTPPAATAYPQTDPSQYNPYVSATQYQASFMSGEGAQSLQNIMSTQAAQYGQTATAPLYTSYTQPPPPVPPAPQSGQYTIPQGAATNYPPGYNPSQYPASAVPPGPPVASNRQGYSQPASQPPAQQYQSGGAYGQYPQYQNYPQKAPQQQFERGQFIQGGGSGGAYSGGQAGPRHRGTQPPPRHPQPRGSSALTTVRITGR